MLTPTSDVKQTLSSASLLSKPANTSFSPPFPTTKPACEAAAWMEDVLAAAAEQNQLGRTKREQDTDIAWAKYVEYSKIRHQQASLLLEEEKQRKKANGLLSKTESEKQAEHAKLLKIKERESLHRMETAKVHLRRVLLARRDYN